MRVSKVCRLQVRGKKGSESVECVAVGRAVASGAQKERRYK